MAKGQQLHFQRHVVEGFADGDKRHIEECGRIAVEEFKKSVASHGYEVVADRVQWDCQHNLIDPLKIDIIIRALVREKQEKKPKPSILERAANTEQMNLLERQYDQAPQPA